MGPHKKTDASFAFSKFLGQRFPVYAECREYTSEFKNGFINHDFSQIWYCLEGKYTHFVEQDAYACTKGSMIIVPAGVAHTFRIQEGDGAEIAVIHVNYEVLLSILPGQYQNMVANLFLHGFHEAIGRQFLPAVQLCDQSQQVAQECISWIALQSYKTAGTHILEDACGRLEQMLSVPELCFPDNTNGQVQNVIQTRVLPVYRSVQYINKHYSEKISEAKLLRAGGISRSGFYRYFKPAIGYTYSQYLQLLRVKHACIYLKYTRYSISYIADACGFFDTHHMTRVFSRYVGESPKKRRAKLRCLYGDIYREK